MTKFQQVESRAELAELERDNAYTVLCERIERERADSVRKRRDMIASAVCVLLSGAGVTLAIYAIAMFGHWLNYGY